MSSINPPTPASTSPLKAFWDALNKGDSDEAYLVFNRAALSGPESTPSPRVAKLIEEGTWDSSMKLALVRLAEGGCAGKINNEKHRFCGKYNCPAVTHEKGARTMPAGWYISAGNSSAGFFRTPWLPLEEDGGPIRRRGASLLAEGASQFRLNLDGWKFVMEGWSGTPSSSTDAQSWDDVEEVELGSTAITGSKAPKDAESQRAPRNLTVETSSEESPIQLPGELETLMETVSSLADRVSVLETQLEEAQEDERYYRKQVRDLLPRTLALERLVQQVGMGSGGPPLGSQMVELETVANGVKELKFEVFNDQGRVMHLKKLIFDLKERQDSGSGVSIGNYKFTSKSDLLSWYEARNPVVGVFMDAHAMMHSVSPTHATISDTMKLLEAQRRVNHKNELETAVRTSFKTIVPSVFIGSNSVIDNSTFAALKSAIKDYNAWKPPQTRGTGVSKRIEEGVLAVDRRISEMRLQGTSDLDTQGLSMALTRDSLLFVSQLCHFIEEQHIMYSDTNYTASQVWDMQLGCLETILEELDAARRPFADAAEYEPGLYLWGMLQAWKIQQRYMRNAFHNDPALMGVFVRQILMSSEDKVLVGKLGKVDELQKTVADNHRNTTAQIKKLQDQMAQMKAK